jgi:hypothetical protein
VVGSKFAGRRREAIAFTGIADARIAVARI